jgi:hypothetical protein
LLFAVLRCRCWLLLMTAGDVLSNDLCCELLLERLAIALAGSTATPTSAGPVAAAPAATIDFAAEMFFLASDLTSVCYGLGSRDNMSAVIGLLPGGAALADTGMTAETHPDRAFEIEVWRGRSMMKLPPPHLRRPASSSASRKIPTGVDWSAFPLESMRRSDPAAANGSGQQTSEQHIECLVRVLTTEALRERFAAQIESIRRVDACSNARSCPW